MSAHFIHPLRLLCLVGLFLASARLSLLFAAGMQAQLPEAEYQALVDLYNSTGGANWKSKSGWLDPSASSWHGVKVLGVVTDANGNVTHKGNVFDLLLAFNGLNGSIPASLGNLERLERLYLSSNNLSGSIPASLGNLGELQQLSLNANWALSGSIPPELGDLSKLTVLALQQNQLSGSIPSELRKLSNLTVLALGCNQLSGGIPSELGDLSELRTLSLGGINFVGSYSNQLSGPIPASLEKLKKLTSLTLSYNQLSGSIPAWLASLTQMQFLQLESNELSGSIPDLSTLHGLIYLHLSSNQLSGSIPAWVTSLLALEDLWLDRNQLTGSIPSDLGNLSSLTRLYLHSNQLSGNIPVSLGNLNNLGYLLLSNNQLSGGIPASLGRLSQLWNLELNDNQLSGGIPSSLGALHELYYLDMDNNHLSCGIPSELLNLFGAHPSFGRLNIASNCLLIDADGKAILDGLRSIGVTVTDTPQQQNCPQPEIVVFGNSKSISDGDSTPSSADHTNFGALPPDAVTITRIFTVTNTGTADLTLGEVVVGGTQAADFSVTQGPSSLVAPGASTTFQVTLTPSAPGMRSATLSFATNDCDENPFDFSIQGGDASDLTMHRAQPAAIENATGTVVDQPLLLKADGAALLASTQKEVLGLVADGVTPLLFHLRQTNLLTTPKYRFTATVTGGGKIFGGQNLGLTALQNGAWTSSASGPLQATLTSVSVTDPDKHAFVCLNAIPNESVSLSAGSREVACDLVAQEVDDSGNAIGTPSTISFLIRKPPIVLVHGFHSDSDSWSSPFLSKLVASRAYDFVLPIDYGTDASAYGYDGYLSINTNGRLDYLARVLDGVLKQDVESPGAGLFADWAITRYDVVGHSQGGVLLRMLCQNVGSNIPLFSSTPFRDSSNNYRGRFRRVITIGSPHNGSRLSYYVQGLAKTDHFPLPAVMKGLGLLQPKFDPFGEQIRQINNTDSKVDSDAKFNLITSTIEGGKFPQPGSPVPLIYFLPRLTSILPGSAQTIGKTVIPLGSDGVVDLDSESATSFQGTIVNKVSPMGFDICHSPASGLPGGFLFFGVGDGESDTNEPEVAATALDLLDGPASAFGPFVLPKIQSDQAKIDAVTPIALVLDVITYFLPGAPAPPPGSGAPSYSFKLQPYSTQPLHGTVSWYAEAFGFDGPMPDGITLEVEAADSTKVTVTVESWVEGDVVLYANYMSTKGKWIVGKPVVVVSNAMEASLTGLELSPAAPSLLVGQTQAIDILGNYEDLVVSPLYVPGGGVGQITSSNPSVASVDANNVVTARAVGTVTLSVTFKGFSAQTTVTVAPATSSEIAVWSSGVSIPSGSVTPSVPGQTDFGSMPMSGSPLNRTFLISNTGSAALNLTGTPKVAISGANAADFAVTTQATSPVKATTGTTTFSIAFTPSASGTRAATISIASNDSDESPYTFSIQGTGTQPSNADLSGLVLNTASLSPVFSSGITSYTASVPNGTSSLTLTPTKTDAGAAIQVRVNGGSFVAVSSGSASSSLSLNVGANSVDVKVTAQDAITTKTYSLAVTRAGSANAELSNLALSEGLMSPTFASGTTSYTASIPNATASITITPTNADAGATIQVRVNGGSFVPVSSGYSSANLPLNVGANTVDVKVTSQDGSVTKTYTVDITRPQSANADLASLVLSTGTLSPAFASSTMNYTASVTNAASSLSVTPTKADANAFIEVRVNGGSFASVNSGGASSSLSLNVGANSVDVKVTAPDSTTKTYTVVVPRAAGDTANANLSGLTLSAGTLSPAFAIGTTSYTASVTNAASSITVTPSKADANATIQVRVNGGGFATVSSGSASSSLALNMGTNSVDVKVTAQNGTTTKTYSITVTSVPAGTVLAWGNNSHGETTIPAGLIGVIAIAAGGRHTVALNSDGTVVAWGDNTQLQATVPAGLSGVIAIAAGTYHTVALKSDGTVVAWGNNGYGQITVPAGLSGVTAIAAGLFHTVALKTDGTVVAWGYNYYGQTTRTPTTSPFPYTATANPIAGLSGVSAIAAGSYHTLALKSDGTVVAFGGFSSMGAASVPAGLSGVRSIAGGEHFTMALKTDGTVVAWGNNNSGQTTVPAGLTGVSAIAAGGSHAVALKSDGTVVAWGFDNYNQTTVPTGLSGVRAIAAGDYHTVVLAAQPLSTNANLTSLAINAATLSPSFASGTTYYTTTVANAASSVTVTPTKADTNAKIQVRINGGGFTTVSSGSASPSLALNVGTNSLEVKVTAQDGTTTKIYTVALLVPDTRLSSLTLSNGTLSPTFTSGWTNYAVGVPEAITSITITPTLAAPSSTVTVNGNLLAPGNASAPIPLKLGTNVINIVVTAQDGGTKRYYTVTVVRSLHAAVSGTVVAWGNSQGRATVPAGMSGVSAIAAGGYHTVALKNNGTVVAWGDSSAGATTVPAGMSGVSAIAAGGYHTVALKNDGTVVAWGFNNYGQTTVPAGLSGVIAIAAGGEHTVALKNNGSVVAWGRSDSGQTVVPAGLSGVIAIAAGTTHTVALRTDGTVVVWGRSDSGQMTVPAGLNGVIAIAAGGYHTVAIKTDGTVVAWGDNYGDMPPGLNGVSAIATGGYHTVVLKSGGTVVAWGNNAHGQTTTPAGLSGVIAIAAGDNHTLALLGTAPDIAVEQPAGSGLVDAISTVNFGTVNIGSSKTLTFTLKNTGTTSLTGPSGLVITKDGAEAADYMVTNPLVTTLAPGAKTTFTVKFAPTAAGPRNTHIHIVSDDPDESPFDIALGGTGFAKSAITVQPVGSCLVGVDEPAFLSVAATGSGTVTCSWFKNGTPVIGASTTSFYIATTGLTDAGNYSATATNAAGSTTSSSARLGVVSLAPSSVTVNEGSTLTLTVSKAIPTGATVGYQWKRNGSDLANGGVSPAQVISGATSATLSISKADAANAGSYTCLVIMDGRTKESGSFGVTVRLKPVVNPAGPLTWYVSGAVTDLFTATNNPVSFTFTGLPPGVTGSTITGQLSGRPNAATTSPKTFTVAATNAVGIGAARTITYSVADLPSAVTGTFNGLVNRDTTLSAPIAAGGKLQGHGGSLENLVITSTGTFTGTLKLEDKSYTMPVGSRLDAHGTGNPTATVHLLRGTATDTVADLTLTFQINKTTSELTGMVTDGQPGSTPIPVRAWRNPWKTTGTAGSPANPATSLAGSYTAMMDFADGALDTNADYPQGHGYGTLTITAAGLATWSGVLADGTPVTRSTTMGPNGEVPLHWILYTPKMAATAGSAHGWVKVQAGADPSEPDDNLLDTMLDLTQADPKNQPMFDWMKKSQAETSTTRSYKSGIPLHKLTIKGGGYMKPSVGVRVLGITKATDNAKLSFSSANLETAMTYLNAPNGPSTSMNGKAFTITNTNTVVMPTLPSATVANPAKLALKLDAKTGAISGSFTLKNDPDPTKPGTFLPRTVNYYGVLVPRLSKGFGCFQLPQMPGIGPPKTTLSTSPQLSGQVLIEVVAP